MNSFFLVSFDMLTITSITAEKRFISHLWKRLSYGKVISTGRLVSGWCHCHSCMFLL